MIEPTLNITDHVIRFVLDIFTFTVIVLLTDAIRAWRKNGKRKK